MEQIKLKDGTTLSIEGGATENQVCITVADFNEITPYEESFTDENLSRFEILNKAGMTTAVLKDKHLKSITSESVSDGYKVAFNFSDVDVVTKRLNTLEQTQAEIIESQEIQDGAIAELAEVLTAEDEEV